MDQLLRTGNNAGSMIVLKKFAPAESPVHADAVKTGICGCLHVNLGIADVNSLFLISAAKLLQRLVGHVRSWLSADAVHFADRKIKKTVKKLLHQRLYGNIRFIGNNGGLDTGLPERAEYLRDTVIGAGFIVAVCGITGDVNLLDTLYFFRIYAF